MPTDAFTEPPPPYDLSNFTVLVVEDSPYMVSLIGSMLRIFSVGDIMECHNAHEAIEVLTVTQARSRSRFVTSVDIVLMDWLMPRAPGRELLQWIRNHPKDDVRFLPVVVVSGYTTERIVNEARDLGANESLVKPISAKGLASRITSVIKNPRPFIEVSTYFGPDRRRQETKIDFADRRVMPADQIQVVRA